MSHPGKMLGEVLRNSVQTPATEMYPFTPAHVPSTFRGRISFTAERCTGCQLCVKDCPARAIEIIRVAPKRHECRIHLGRCIYCAQCVETCPREALSSTPDFELAALSPDGLEIVFHAPEAPPVDAAPEKLENPAR
jgi:formate hydrogenlyase subunit 6/NADH:ubiquinone oxidoreductase subunit I